MKYPNGQIMDCDNPVVVRDWKYFSFKHHCSDCLRKIQKGLPSRPGVIFTKKTYCENRDGRLGFSCPVNPNFQLRLCIKKVIFNNQQ